MKNIIFISSTFADLKEERKEVWQLLGQFDVLVKGMEEFGARKEDSLTTCLTELRQADIYVGIIGYRLGSIEKKTSKSYTQLEYEEAYKQGKEILIYLMDEENSKIHPKNIEFDKIEQLNSFKELLKERHTVDFFKDSNDLRNKLERQFKKHLTKKNTEPKEKDEYIDSKKTLEKFFLIPKSISGAEAKLRVKFGKEITPASQEICEMFQMEFGKTVLSDIEIIKPEIDAENFRHIFISHKLIDEFLGLDKNNAHEIYGMVFFYEQKAKTLKTSFMDKSYTYAYDVTKVTSDFFRMDMLQAEPSEFYTKKEEGEGQIILILKEIVKK
ncbi:MAG: DUF4062 domain-containing protein [bacterium]